MTPNEYQKLALRTEQTKPFLNTRNEDGDLVPDHRASRLMHGAVGICTEAGELQDMLKKSLIYGRDLDLVNVMEEAGDLLWYIALVLDASGYTIEQAMERNIAKLAKRYGEKFSEFAALNRDLDAERAALEKARESVVDVEASAYAARKAKLVAAIDDDLTAAVHQVINPSDPKP